MDLAKLDKVSDSIESTLSKVENNVNKSMKRLTKNPKVFTSTEDNFNLIKPVTLSKEEVAKKEQGSWLGIAAVICFVLAGGFTIRLSMEYEWMTPIKQIGIVTLFGISLIFSRVLFVNIDNKYSSFLPAAGVIILYMTVIEGEIYYSQMFHEVVIISYYIISFICICLYRVTRHDFYIITSAMGVYFAPFVNSTAGPYTHISGVIFGVSDKVFIHYYFLLCSIICSFISIWVHSRKLMLVSGCLAIFMTGLSAFFTKQGALVPSILALNFLVFSFGSYLYSRINNVPLTTKEAKDFLPVILMFYVMEYGFLSLSNIQVNLAPWLSLGFAVILNLLYIFDKKHLPETLGGEQWMLIFTTIICFHSIYYIFSLNGPSALLALISFIFAFSFSNFSDKKLKVRFYILIIALCLIILIKYFSMIRVLLPQEFNIKSLVATAFCFCFGILTFYSNKPDQQNKGGQLLLVAAHLLAVSGLWRLTSDINSLAVSASWLFYAVCIMIFSYKRRDLVMIRSALLILVLASGKALLYDASGAENIVRILCLLLTGVVLYGSGLVIRKTNEWQ
jgi:hypothetical protein